MPGQGVLIRSTGSLDWAHRCSKFNTRGARRFSADLCIDDQNSGGDFEHLWWAGELQEPDLPKPPHSVAKFDTPIFATEG